MASSSGSLLTDRLLRSWVRCRRRAWLDRHGPAAQRLWSAHRALALDDQLRSFQTLLPEPPGRGEAACLEGAPGVVGLRLRGEGPGGTALEAHPSLLERIPSRSRWGTHAYRPVLARQGHRVTREHRLQLALWGTLLSTYQGTEVRQGLVLAGSGASQRRERITLTAGLREQLDDSLKRLAEDLERPQPPPLVSDRRKCTLCGWRSLCDRQAAQDGHLSEVSGIGGRRREMLLGLGITNLSELAAADPDWLAEALAAHGEQHREAAVPIVTQARVQLAGIPRRRDGAPALPELGEAQGVLVYDIESDPDLRDDFLHGVLLIRREADGSWPRSRPRLARYQPILALREHGEASLWRRLCRLLQSHPDWPVLHYGETEAISLLRLAERQGATQRDRDQLRRRMVDVHQRLRRHWIMPLNGYGLKVVADALGFAWTQPGVDGARCLLWWRQWNQWRRSPPSGRAPGRRARSDQLRRILRYNEDDAQATWVVARWLLDTDPATDHGARPPAEPLSLRLRTRPG